MTGFWVFMLMMDLLIPLTMIGFGRLFINKPPKSINYIYGYRTAMSMKNKDTWEFAHNYCGKLWFTLGLALLPLSIIPLIIVFGKEIEAVGTVGGIVCLVQWIPMVGSLLLTETALKRAFDQRGMRKSDSGPA